MTINDDTSVQAGLTDGTDIDMGFVAEQPATKPKKTMRNDPPMVKTPPAAKAKALVQKPSAKPTAKPIPDIQPEVMAVLGEQIKKWS